MMMMMNKTPAYFRLVLLGITIALLTILTACYPADMAGQPINEASETKTVMQTVIATHRK